MRLINTRGRLARTPLIGIARKATEAHRRSPSRGGRFNGRETYEEMKGRQLAAYPDLLRFFLSKAGLPTDAIPDFRARGGNWGTPYPIGDDLFVLLEYENESVSEGWDWTHHYFSLCDANGDRLSSVGFADLRGLGAAIAEIELRQRAQVSRLQAAKARALEALELWGIRDVLGADPTVTARRAGDRIVLDGPPHAVVDGEVFEVIVEIDPAVTLAYAGDYFQLTSRPSTARITSAPTLIDALEAAGLFREAGRYSHRYSEIRTTALSAEGLSTSPASSFVVTITGDGNVVGANNQVVTQINKELERTSGTTIANELAVLRGDVVSSTRIPDKTKRQALRAIEDVEDELTDPTPNPEVVGTSLGRAVTILESAGEVYDETKTWSQRVAEVAAVIAAALPALARWFGMS